MLSAVGFAAVLAAAGWTPSFLSAAAVSVGSAALALAAAARLAAGAAHRACRSAQALAAAAHGVREAWAEPGTRLGFWLGFMALFTGMTFGVMWGYPFLTVGQGLSPGSAGALMLGLAAGRAGLRRRHWAPSWRTTRTTAASSRSAVVLVVAAIWAVVLLWPGRAPLWLLVVLVLACPRRPSERS